MKEKILTFYNNNKRKILLNLKGHKWYKNNELSKAETK